MKYRTDFVTGLMEHLREHAQHYLAAESATLVLIAERCWFRGANIPGKPKGHPPYAGSLITFRKRLEAMPEDGYWGFDFQTPASVST